VNWCLVVLLLDGGIVTKWCLGSDSASRLKNVVSTPEMFGEYIWSSSSHKRPQFDEDDDVEAPNIIHIMFYIKIR
jgi:hypothetical protein